MRKVHGPTQEECASSSLHFANINPGEHMITLAIQMKAMAFAMLSSFSRNPVLKGFNNAWYLSTDSTLRVMEETVVEISMKIVNLQPTFPNPRNDITANMDANKMPRTSLTAMFANRKLVGVCMFLVLWTIRITSTFPINPMIKNGTVVHERITSRRPASIIMLIWIYLPTLYR